MASTDSSSSTPDQANEPSAQPKPAAENDWQPSIAVLNERDLDDLLALSRASNWNQNADDWRWMLASGRTRGLRLNGRVIASTLVLPWPPVAQPAGGHPQASGNALRAQVRLASGLTDTGASRSVAWISMVLVLPEYRRQGHASRLLRDALGWLGQPGQRHLLPVLDATPAGREVYLQEGFHDTWGFARWQCAQTEMRASVDIAAPRLSVRSMPAQGLGGLATPLANDLLGLDCRAFGADRRHLIAALIKRSPRTGFVAVEQIGDKLTATGYILARPGRQATQIGPLVARDALSARLLLAKALKAISGPVFIDIPDQHTDLRTLLEAAGFTVQRPFSRMVFGADREAPGDASVVWAVAGPELG
ncbi:MAG: hypothetical protein RLZZ153_370 [Pseudomonadota bacterium]|jgi:GNAT superfamily N-acetyltransferase